MKKIIAASVLCTSLLGFNLPVTEAANICPAPKIVKIFPQNYNATQTDLQQLINQYFKQYQQTKPAAPAQQVQEPAKQPTQTITKPAQNTAPAQAQAPVTNTTTQGLTADEKQMLDLVNQERAKQGITPLKINMELQKLARLKAKDMIENNYFSHQSPTYGSPFDMMNRFGVTYRTAGENIAGNSSVQGAHTSLMNSPGHRKNILNPSFTEVGIGIVDGGPYGKMFVQMFKG
ncbi:MULTISPECIES: CAP domain-containing protein [Aneurinibacillus]|uniref:SCP domain-containing protein n=1 Tax=Aneurinibacillus thermoaerophilus TaxID=143495 RepID=A0ABX8Y7R5_ANETH|nr:MULTISPECIES: CAP domain-containing protein [Aneurinibacillus]AMA72845.1 hypothetical protein ACH33_08250 [Aneurinibacillus sp. XH2]MED0738170.1 CAP domain-containing protein [Aneurinibacillus thermoaerophilus]QYY41395.1 hypothetical protein K3F53_10585 [Aneurinibacillus thermoaerophilus]